MLILSYFTFVLQILLIGGKNIKSLFNSSRCIHSLKEFNIEKQDFYTSKNNAVFWSIQTDQIRDLNQQQRKNLRHKKSSDAFNHSATPTLWKNRVAAQEWAMANGKMTLELTRGGKILNKFVINEYDTKNILDP